MKDYVKGIIGLKTSVQKDTYPSGPTVFCQTSGDDQFSATLVILAVSLYLLFLSPLLE